jgi:hypothetical protein
MAAIPKFDEPNLQALSDILGDTSTGLTGSEIGRFLRECGFPDPMCMRARSLMSIVGRAVEKVSVQVAAAGF